MARLWRWNRLICLRAISEISEILYPRTRAQAMGIRHRTSGVGIRLTKPEAMTATIIMRAIIVKFISFSRMRRQKCAHIFPFLFFCAGCGSVPGCRKWVDCENLRFLRWAVPSLFCCILDAFICRQRRNHLHVCLFL